jgi:hypothetical protein
MNIKEILQKIKGGDRTKEMEFREITDELQKLYAKKSADYGDTCEQMADKYGEVYWTMMIQQKIGRIEALAKKEDVRNESMEDSYRDIANYAILALINHKRKNI